MLDKLFKLSEKGTTVKTEILAGVTTFLAMAYILAVNQQCLVKRECLFKGYSLQLLLLLL